MTTTPTKSEIDAALSVLKASGESFAINLDARNVTKKTGVPLNIYANSHVAGIFWEDKAEQREAEEYLREHHPGHTGPISGPLLIPEGEKA